MKADVDGPECHDAMLEDVIEVDVLALLLGLVLSHLAREGVKVVVGRDGPSAAFGGGVEDSGGFLDSSHVEEPSWGFRDEPEAEDDGEHGSGDDDVHGAPVARDVGPESVCGKSDGGWNPEECPHPGAVASSRDLEGCKTTSLSAVCTTGQMNRSRSC